MNIMASPIRRIVLDVLKPHDPSMVEFATEVSETDGVEGVNAILLEVDEKVDNVKVTAVGEDIDYDRVREKIDGLGASVHSVDEIVCGEKIVEESKTPQD